MDLLTRPRRCHLVLVTAAALAGIRPASAADTELQQRAEFYSQYAALAADVYITGGRVDKLVPMALASPWLRRQIKESQDAGAAERYEALAVTARQAQRDERADEMPRFASLTVSPEGAVPPDSSASSPPPPLVSRATPGTYEAPRSPEDCNREDAPIALVPVKARTGWERLPELHRETSARGWSMFVPDLAMDVWRRKRPPEGGHAVFEYAIVYRGTDGAGGWFSNMRGFFANTPMVWDQYQQAMDITSDTLKLIDNLHALTDTIFGRTAEGVKTKLLFTTVGHSLGAGIARFVYLRDKRVTRVVGFNPSPIDGSSQILIDRRNDVDLDRAPIDGDARAPGASMFMLYEHGEVLNIVSGGCPTGPVWGDGGGPRMHCESVNLSHGNWVRQHGMRQLACKLHFTAWGGDPAPATTAARAP